jgi:hypothetical protein
MRIHESWNVTDASDDLLRDVMRHLQPIACHLDIDWRGQTEGQRSRQHAAGVEDDFGVGVFR